MTDDPGTKVTTLDLRGCARCQGVGHLGIIFHPLIYPFVPDAGDPFTHWAPCPTNGEPILMRWKPTPTEAKKQAAAAREELDAMQRIVDELKQHPPAMQDRIVWYIASQWGYGDVKKRTS